MNFNPFSRIFFTNVAVVFLIILVSAGGVRAQSDSLSFLHVTDTHLIFDLEDYHPGVISKRKHYGNGIVPLKNLLDSIVFTRDIRFVSITGDLVDFCEASTENSGMRSFQLERFCRLIDQYPLPVFLNMGNHDIAAYGWKNDQMTSSQKNAGMTRAAWIRSAHSFRNGTYYSQALTVGGTDYRLIFLDNGHNSDASARAPYLDRIQLDWLREQLAISEKDIEIVFMHIPVADDKSPSELLETLVQSPTVKLVLSGHEHRNHTSWLGSQKRLFQVQTAAFARNPNEWRRITLTAKSVVISKPGSRLIEQVIPLDR
ncbi:hypothetical protein GCM10023091_11310 [Ravibacter arvi]|uniref:Calcineurin-like phosphoesterase domain-containing protein n=1 Tax=Ravibacter arvi TaxID=2051041 RepID=A0ABP8LV34_9BACT